VVLGVLPLFHVYGLNAVLGVVMRHRAKLVLTGRFEVQGTLDLIEDEACSVVPVAPPVFAYWRDVEGLEERLGPVRLMLSGSAPLSPELAREFTGRTGIPIHQGYGLTETAPSLTLLSSEHGLAKIGSAGQVPSSRCRFARLANPLWMARPWPRDVSRARTQSAQTSGSFHPPSLAPSLACDAMMLKRSHSKNTCPPPAGPSPKSASDRVLLPQRRIQLVTQRNQIVFHRR